MAQAQQLDQRLGATTLALDNNYGQPNFPSNDWVWPTIDRTNWNNRFPYQFQVLDAARGYSTVSKFPTFTLPLAPSEISITMSSAIGVSATLGGVVEEHNAAPFRIITLSGTTGVTPLRGRADVLGKKSAVQSIFAGTLGAATKIASDFGKLFGSGSTFNLVNENDNEFLNTTGYYQFQLLSRFFESYLNAKKLASNRTLRLVFCMWKDNARYVCTPLDFVVQKSASSPLEYTFNIQLKAYKRIKLQGQADPFQAFEPIPDDPNLFQSILNRIQEVRKVIQDAQDIVAGAQADIEGIIETAREITFFAKDIIGVGLAIADLPVNVIQTAGDALLEAKTVLAQLNLGPNATDDSRQVKADWVQCATQLNKPESLSSGQVNVLDIIPSNVKRTLDNATEHYDFFNAIPIGQLNIRPQTVKLIATERARVRNLTRLDFEKRRDTLIQSTADFADNVGAGSPTFNAIYGRKIITSTRIPTPDDFEILFQLNELALCLNYLVSSSKINTVQTTSVDYIAGLATQSGIAFQIPRSKFLIPFPYGSTLEQLAFTYLNDPLRWLEIASLNGLQTPYVDEVGFDLPLIVQGSGSQIQVSDVRNLFIGQLVYLSSNTFTTSKRHITGIRRITSTDYIISLDGDPTLNLLKPNDQALLHTYLPNTVNSQMMIYIPSDTELTGQDLQTKSIPGINLFDNLLLTGGTDILLTPEGDWAITPDGDVKVAQGLTNLIQRARITLLTPQGSLILHPSFGLPLEIGASTADYTTDQLLAAAKDLFKGDDSFTGVQGASVVKQGPNVFLSIGIGIQGINDLIPITVAVKQ